MSLWHLWVDVTHLPRASGIIHCNMRVCFEGLWAESACAAAEELFIHYVVSLSKLELWETHKFWHLPSVCKAQKAEGLLFPALLKWSEYPPQHVCDRQPKCNEAQGLRALRWEQWGIHLINRCKAFKLDGAYAVFQMAQLIRPCILTMKHDDAF